MRLRVFQSDKGDCLLLTAADGTQVLADGGMRASYREHVAPALGRLASRGGRLDLVYVSHIDRDHISGVLALMDDLVAWRVYDYQRARGNARFPKPEHPRPPEVGGLWHNAFGDQVGENAGPISRALAQRAAVLDASDLARDRALARHQRELATSVGEGIELSRRARPDQLGIPLNAEFGGRLAMVRGAPAAIALGPLRLTVIGPFEPDLRALREDWNAWLEENERELDRIRRRMASDVERLAAGELERFRAAIDARARELGDRSKVTVPNLASLMVLVEEDGRTLLLTGDGHARDIVAGLDRAGRLKDGRLHVDVLKVQHHGSEHNLDSKFLAQVSADHYVFCANGAHENPDLGVLEALVESRLGAEAERAGDARAARPFKLWFNSSPRAAGSEANRRHMQAVADLVKGLTRAAKGRLRSSFLDDHSFEIRLTRRDRRND